MLTFGSLFAGIGGFDLAFERAAMQCIVQVENDERCRTVLAHHWPDVDRSIEDVRNFGKRTWQGGAISVITGGFPCQDVSVAGQREGLAGERSGLWFEFRRIVEELEPRWVIVENVPGLLSSNGGRDFATILRGLVECGYGVCWRILDAQYAGVPQRRRRVFIVGSLGDGRAAEVLFERTSSAWDPPPSRETRERVAAPLTRGSATGSGVNEPGRRREDDVNLAAAGVSENQRAELRLTPYSRQLTSGGGKPGQGYPCVLTFPGMAQSGAGRAPASMPVDEERCGPLDTKRAQCVAIDARNCTVDEETTMTLQAHKRSYSLHTVPHVTAFEPRYYARDNKTGGAPQETADITNAHKAGDSAPHVLEIHGGSKRKDRPTGGFYVREMPTTKPLDTGGCNPNCAQGGMAALTAFGVRRLTPRECERLQGFPDDFTAIDGMSDSARYRMLGNAVAVPVVEWIARRIVEVENERS